MNKTCFFLKYFDKEHNKEEINIIEKFIFLNFIDNNYINLTYDSNLYFLYFN